VNTPQEPGAYGWPRDGRPEPEPPANGRHAPPDGTVPLESLFSPEQPYAPDQAPTPSSYDAPPAYGASAYDTHPAYGTPAAPERLGAEPVYPSPSPFDTVPPDVQSPPGTRSPPGTPGPPDRRGRRGQPGAEGPPEPPPQLEPQYRGAPADGREPHVSIVLPCFNEQDHVLREVERISRVMDASGLPYELIAVDDASTDATLERLRSAEPNLPRMRIVHFPRNGGAGTVRRIGTQQAKGEIVVWTDADMTYPNERIPEFVAMLDADSSIDQVIGARTSEEGTHKVARVPAKWFIRKLAEKLTNSQIPDLNSGLRAFRRDVALPYLRLLPPGFSCVTTITLAFLSNEHGVVYVPIDYAKRAGVSKFRFVSDAYRYILQVLRMVMYFNPLKVLMPPALFLLGLGILKGIYDMVVHPLYFAINTVLIFVSGLIIASLALLADLIVRSRGDT
jgi:glycosyltransferase involved in cell wall biosynthesis